jgi:uncharacterized protein YjbJ (UPF0337 family)
MDKNGKILLATLSGIGAGIVAGILLAPDNGQTTRDSVKRSLTKAGEDMERTMKNWMSKLEKSGTTGAGSSLVMHGSWDDVKGQLKQNYAELTEEDLTYAEGKEDELFGRLQVKLGKTKEDIADLIDNIRNSLK